ncbi:protein ORF103 [Anguillid herpesvirus 1]|uniref:Protein ORF103 n=1 Tax=Anguillid herpesvirus 1 TaxID=150286 RepID=A0A1J0REH0_9VIRU|nr:protein ORF103 [Anguillid herpesvirus 1]ADA57866.1 protein ORF103 [Anguillid herpesvirus 1]APD76267.1 ORF103 [Anguillid herpesvirus 1]QRM16398.1 protein ORF103 [Anguillid herpesvirus 1]QRM16525.1 protein ORF103 [Anguillid herpesvirus 1]QRM16657.1 protein ORF103 [Anguillid herpesvirus 1]
MDWVVWLISQVSCCRAFMRYVEARYDPEYLKFQEEREILLSLSNEERLAFRLSRAQTAKRLMETFEERQLSPSEKVQYAIAKVSHKDAVQSLTSECTVNLSVDRTKQLLIDQKLFSRRVAAQVALQNTIKPYLTDVKDIEKNKLFGRCLEEELNEDLSQLRSELTEQIQDVDDHYEEEANEEDRALLLNFNKFLRSDEAAVTVLPPEESIGY